MRVVLRDIDPHSLVDAFGPVRYAAAVQYVKRKAVVQMVWVNSQQALCGVVRGGNGEFYTPAVYFAEAENGEMEILRDQCSCRSRRQCEHAAALLLAGTESNIGSVQIRAASRQQEPERKPDWTHTLESILTGDTEAPRARFTIGIELSLGSDKRLMARLVQPGKNSGWINGNLSWSRLDVMYTRDYPMEQLQVLREIRALYRARASESSHYYAYGEEKLIEFSAFDSHQLWALLDEATKTGIRIVHSKLNGAGEVARYPGAELCLDITQGEEELRVTPKLTVEGTDQKMVAVQFIGSDAHGVVCVPEADTRGDPVSWRFGLAQLKTPIPANLRKLALTHKPLAVPAEDEQRFRDRFYPRLRHAATVISSDDSFTAPTISEPTLVLRANYGDNHDVALDWEWSYQIGDSTERIAMGQVADAPYRDLAAEQRLLDSLPVRPRDLESGLGGLDTMRFTTEMIPLLSGRSGVNVEVEGTPADYREASDSLQIGVSVDDNGTTDWFDLGVAITVEGREVPFADLFMALSRGDAHMLLPDGAYFTLEKPELQTLRKLIEEARSLTDGDGPITLSPFQAGLWDELAALGVVTRQARAWQEKVQGLLSLDCLPSITTPPGLQATLRPYQLEGFQWLAFLWSVGLGGILADDMGLGKTLESLALLAHAREKAPDAPPFLIVAPTSVVPNWASEAARFTPGLKVATIYETDAKRGASLDAEVADADFVVTSYTLFRLDFEAYSTIKWSGLILDEAQYTKNHQSKIYQCARKLAAPFKVAITGTPMENNLMELWSLLSITAPGLFPRPDKFKEFYAQPIERQRDAELLGQLRRRIRPLMKRRTKEQVAADLPDKQEQILQVAMHPQHRTVYERHLQRERQKVLGLIGDMNANRFTILRSITRLRQLALHAGLVEDEHSGLPCAKIDALLEQLEDVVDGGHRALVFSQFTSFLALVRERLDKAKIEYCYLDGSTRDRGSVLDRFKNGAAPVFLISLKAGGFGLNLTEADYCFLLDPWWNPAAEAQAIDRVHRIGQTRNVMVYRLIAKDSIEEKVLALNARKAELFTNVMDDGNAFGGSMTADDIRNLFA